MQTSPTARYLAHAIEASPKTQREIARDAGFNAPNILTMLKLGQTKVPLDRIPALAHACDVDPAEFLEIAMQEYHPEIWNVLHGIFGPPLSPNEERLLMLLQLADMEGDFAWSDGLERAVAAVLDLGRPAG